MEGTCARSNTETFRIATEQEIEAEGTWKIVYEEYLEQNASSIRPCSETCRDRHRTDESTIRCSSFADVEKKFRTLNISFLR